jgi:hypothetical protein
MEKLSQTHTLYRVKMSKPSGWVKRDDLRDEQMSAHGITKAKNQLTTRMDAFNNRELKDLNNVHASLRKVLKELMLPWDERGFWIVANKRIPQVEKGVTDHKNDADEKLEIFLSSYANHVISEKDLMGTAFREKDYPSEEILRNKHKIEVDIAIVPDPEEDARAGWTSEMRNRYRVQLQKQEKEKVSRATLDVADRIGTHIKKVLDRMNEYDGKKLGSFNDSLIQNVRDMASMIPEFNLTNDPEVDAVYQKIVRDICTLDPKKLRDSEEMRKEAATSSQEILDRLGNFGVKSD